MSIFFQAGIWSAFKAGNFEGDVSYNTLATRGDTGLGTFNNLSGEMIACDGLFYHINGDGKAEIAAAEMLTPFAMVSHLKPTAKISVDESLSLREFTHTIHSHLSRKNIFYLIQLNCDLYSIKLRTERPHHKVEGFFDAVLNKIQFIFQLNKINGTMIITYCPKYFSAITMPGYHYHFITEDRNIGGHVLDFHLIRGTAHIMPIYELSIMLFNNEEFNSLNLNISGGP